MKAAVFIITLFALVMGAPKVESQAYASEFFKDYKEKIFNCVLKKTTDETLIQYIKDHESDSFDPLAFRDLKLNREQRTLIKECKREALKKSKKSTDNKEL